MIFVMTNTVFLKISEIFKKKDSYYFLANIFLASWLVRSSKIHKLGKNAPKYIQGILSKNKNKW